MSYVPERADLIWLEFSPHSGHEQAGQRPGLVLTPSSYNSKSGLAIICPITTKVKPYPFLVSLPDGLKISGVVQADQAKSVDWNSRNAVFICESPREVFDEVIGKLETLLF